MMEMGRGEGKGGEGEGEGGDTPRYFWDQDVWGVGWGGGFESWVGGWGVGMLVLVLMLVDERGGIGAVVVVAGMMTRGFFVFNPR